MLWPQRTSSTLDLLPEQEQEMKKHYTYKKIIKHVYTMDIASYKCWIDLIDFFVISMSVFKAAVGFR